LEWEHGQNVGGIRVGWDVSEEVGRVWKYVIFIALSSKFADKALFMLVIIP
jgi:hypothetical protein